MSQEQARQSPMGHALVNVLGGKTDELSIDVDRISLEPDDVLLVCTDGLYDMVPEDELYDILVSNDGAEASCRQLLDLANEHGGKDNITMIVARFSSPKTDEPSAFVDAEVPLDLLTDFVSDSDKSTMTFNSGSLDH